MALSRSPISGASVGCRNDARQRRPVTKRARGGSSKMRPRWMGATTVPTMGMGGLGRGRDRAALAHGCEDMESWRRCLCRMPVKPTERPLSVHGPCQPARHRKAVSRCEARAPRPQKATMGLRMVPSSRVGALGKGRGHRPSGPSSKRTPGAGADAGRVPGNPTGAPRVSMHTICQPTPRFPRRRRLACARKRNSVQRRLRSRRAQAPR